jgi:ligand-binding SRPBCC domain-containing protein
MKIYTLHRKQVLPISLQDAWDFFSTPRNLSKITPEKMNFRILHISGGDKVYAGQIIRYKVQILPFYSTGWVTEITHMQEPSYFIDEQRFGPYALWHHQHHFKAVDGGVEMTDEVSYAIPFGLLGRFAHRVFVGREVNSIFNHRFSTLEKFFTRNTQ